VAPSKLRSNLPGSKRSIISGLKRSNSPMRLSLRHRIVRNTYFNFDLEFDKNVITPGTEFMDRLSKALAYYVQEKLHNDALWKGLKVVFSDASVPGEGEHKILDFIRSQRA